MVERELSREGMSGAQAPTSGKRHIGRRRAVPKRREIGRKSKGRIIIDELPRTQAKNR